MPNSPEANSNYGEVTFSYSDKIDENSQFLPKQNIVGLPHERTTPVLLGKAVFTPPDTNGIMFALADE